MAAILCNSSRLFSKRVRRRSMSTALCRAVEISHARGFSGSPWVGHCSRAAAKASWVTSSGQIKTAEEANQGWRESCPTPRDRFARCAPDILHEESIRWRGIKG